MFNKVGINSINNINFGNKKAEKVEEKQVQTSQSITELQGTSPDYSVKVPMKYSELPDLKLPNDLTAKCYKLANGQKIVIVPKKGETTIRTYVNTGSMNEPDNLRGISHYIEHNLFNGSEGLQAGEFFQRVHEMGGETNASTGFDQTNYYISSNLLRESDFEEMVKLHSSMLQTPKFTNETLEKEKGIVCSEINMITQNPENIVINRAIKNLYGIQSSSTDMIGGTTDNIMNVTREDVLKYYNDNYHPANMTTVITGEVEPEDGMKLVSKYFTSKAVPNNAQNYEKLNPINDIKREDIISDKATSTMLAIAINAPENSNLKERLALDCAFELLVGGVSSRINSKLRDEDVFVGHSEERFANKPDSNTIRILDASSDDEGVEKALKVILNEIKNFGNVQISKEELDVLKKTAIKYNLRNYEDNYSINSRIGNAFLNGNVDFVQKYEEVMNSITQDDIKNAVEKYLAKENFSIAVIHPQASTEQTIKEAHKKVNEPQQVAFTGGVQTQSENKVPKKQRNIVPIDLEEVKNYKLPNNINLVTKNTNEKIGYFKILFDRKDIDREHPVEGSVLCRLLDNGSLKQDDVTFYKELKDNCIKINTFATAEYISVSADYYNKDIDKVLEKLKDIVFNPRLTEAEFQKEKEFIKRDMLLREKSAYDKLETELEPKNCLSKEDFLKKLDELTLDDVRRVYEKILNNSQVTVAISGPIDTDEKFRNSVINNLSSMAPVKEFQYKLKETFKPIEQTKVLTDTDFKNQAEIVQRYRFKMNHNIHDNVSLVLMNKILGGSPSSRLFMDLRESQQLAYRVKSSIMFNEDYDDGNLELSIGTTTENTETGELSYDNIQKSIVGFNKNIERLKSEKVTQEELDNAKLAMKNALLSDLQTTENINFELAASFLRPSGLHSVNNVMAEIDKITVEDIQRAANYVFSTKPMYSILATENSLNANKEFLKTLEQ